MTATQSQEKSLSSQTPTLPLLSIHSALRAGDDGGDVIRLQQMLNEKGANLYVDGAFGRSTITAVKRFQQTHGLLPNGVAEANTLSALLQTEKNTLLTLVADSYNPQNSLHQMRTLDWLQHEIPVALLVEFTHRWADRLLPPEPVLYHGDRNESVREFKQLLHRQDSLVMVSHEDEIDCHFDAAAEVAVFRFQHQHNLTGDGIVGPLTWRQLRCPTKLMPLAKRLNSYRPKAHPSQRAALMWLQNQLPDIVLREFSMRWHRQEK